MDQRRQLFEKERAQERRWLYCKQQGGALGYVNPKAQAAAYKADESQGYRAAGFKRARAGNDRES